MLYDEDKPLLQRPYYSNVENTPEYIRQKAWDKKNAAIQSAFMGVFDVATSLIPGGAFLAKLGHQGMENANKQQQAGIYGDIFKHFNQQLPNSTNNQNVNATGSIPGGNSTPFNFNSFAKALLTSTPQTPQDKSPFTTVNAGVDNSLVTAPQSFDNAQQVDVTTSPGNMDWGGGLGFAEGGKLVIDDAGVRFGYKNGGAVEVKGGKGNDDIALVDTNTGKDTGVRVAKGEHLVVSEESVQALQKALKKKDKGKVFDIIKHQFEQEPTKLKGKEGFAGGGIAQVDPEGGGGGKGLSLEDIKKLSDEDLTALDMNEAHLAPSTNEIIQKELDRRGIQSEGIDKAVGVPNYYKTVGGKPVIVGTNKNFDASAYLNQELAGGAGGAGGLSSFWQNVKRNLDVKEQGTGSNPYVSQPIVEPYSGTGGGYDYRNAFVSHMGQGDQGPVAPPGAMGEVQPNAQPPFDINQDFPYTNLNQNGPEPTQADHLKPNYLQDALGLAGGTAFDLYRGVKGWQAANTPLPKWQTPAPWNEYMNRLKGLSETGLTGNDLSRLSTDADRTYAYDVANIYNVANGNAGMVLGNLGRAAGTKYGAAQNVASINDQARARNRALYGSYLGQDVNLNRMQFNDAYQNVLWNKQAGSQLANDAIKNTKERFNYFNEYGPGSLYDKVQNKQYENLNETNDILKAYKEYTAKNGFANTVPGSMTGTANSGNGDNPDAKALYEYLKKIYQ